MNNSQEFTLFHYHLGPQAARDRAAQFMSGDVHRGIVELLTNSDTAYSTMKEISRNRRPIEVRISRSSSHRWFEVRDRAGGMNSETLRDKFTQGGATSTAGERGYFGLGAKDCAVFGEMTVETVDQSGNLNKVELSRNYIDNKIYKSRKATPEDYTRLFGRNRKATGTVIHVDLASQNNGGPSMPLFDSLYQKLRTHYPLRALINRNDVTLSNHTNQRKNSRKLNYPNPPWDSQDAVHLTDEYLTPDVNLDQTGQNCHLRLFKLPDEIPGLYSDESFDGFILVRSNVAAYGITLAGMETHPQGKRLVGELIDQNIPALLDSFRAHGPTEKNPYPVIKQSRDHKDGGLEAGHPCAQALMKELRNVVQKYLDELVSETKEAERAGASSALNNANREAGTWLGSYLDSEGTEPHGLPPGFYFLPPARAIPPYTDGSLYVYFVASEPPPQRQIQWDTDDNQLIQLRESMGEIEQLDAQSEYNVFRARVLFTAKDEGRTRVRATLGLFDSAEASIEIRPDTSPKEEFAFDSRLYSLQPSRRKTVRLIIPTEVLQSDRGDQVRFSIVPNNETVVLSRASVVNIDVCKPNKYGQLIMPLAIEGRAAGSSVVLTATYGELSATARVRVAGRGMPVKLDDKEIDPPADRATIFEETCPEHSEPLCLHVFVRHSRIQPFIGDPIERDDGQIEWGLVDSPGFRAMYADAVAEAAAQRRVLAKRYPALDDVNPDELFRLFWEEKKTALAQLQKIYIDEQTWNQQTHTQAGGDFR